MAHPARAAQSAHPAQSADISTADRRGMPGADADYGAILATLTATARGRAFLAEHGRRTRGADTTAVLAAIDQIGASLRGEAVPADAPEYLQLGLMAMAGLIAAVENDISALSTGHETPDSTRPRVQRLIGTLRDLGDCIQVMLDSWQTKPEPHAAPPVPVAPPALAVVEPSPVPVSEQSASPADEFAADMAVFDMTVSDPFAPPEPADTAGHDLARANGLAALRALSEAELIALFT